MTSPSVRLSRWVFFVDHEDHTQIGHIASGTTWRTDRATADRLRHWTGFRSLPADLAVWADRCVLVAAGSEPLLAGEGSVEAALEAAWYDWYWAREVEAEREHRWLGEVVLKMPSDLFFYQELITNRGVRRILEIGSGRGGGVWFFASILSLLGGGHIVGVDNDPPVELPNFARFDNVRVDLLHADIRERETMTRLSRGGPFDFIVIDAPPAMDDKLAVLQACASLVADGGAIVVEDLTQPALEPERTRIACGLDDFISEHSAFRHDHDARRHPFLKGSSAIFVRDDLAPTST